MSRFRIFSVLWAIATVFHMAHSSVFDTQLNFALLTVAAFLVIIRPSLGSFILLITFQLFDAFLRMPFTTNHWLFTAFVNLTILHVLIYLVITSRSFAVGEEKLYRAFSPVVRVEVIILYFFAVFHKLNAGFFSHVSSCATVLLKAQGVERIMVLDPLLFKVNVYATILVESGIPLLLCFKRTRTMAICLGVLFHGVLSFSSHNAFFDFGSMMFALYFLFADEDFVAVIRGTIGHWRASATSYLRQFSFGKLMFVSCAIVVSLLVVYLINKRLHTFQAVHLYFFWTVYMVACCYLLISYWITRRTASVNGDRLPVSFMHPSFYLLPVLVFINGTSPYLGLKTENSYAMFSNLRTEGGVSNHFLIPADIQPFRFQKDIVQIVSSTDPALEQLAVENKALVLFEFNNYVLARRPERVEYLVNGEPAIYNRDYQSANKNIRPNPYLLAKLMKFRPFTLSETQPCSH